MSWPIKVLAPLLIVAVASAIRWQFFSSLGRGIPFLTYYPAVMLAALYGGIFSGILATVLSASLCFFWIQRGFISPIESLAIGVFLFSCTMISAISEGMRRAQSQARRAKENWNRTFDAMQDGVCLLDQEGRFLQCNRATARLSGQGPASLLGQCCHEAMHGTPDFIPGCPFQRMLESGQRESLEVRVQDRWFEAIADPMRDEDGIIRGAVHILRDVTAHKVAEAELRASEARFRLSFDLASIGKSLTGVDGRLLRINDAFCRMLGYERVEMETKNFAEFTHPNDVAASQEAIRTLLIGESPNCHFQKRYLHRDGHIVWADVNTVLLRDPVSGEALHLITHVQDITERHRILIALQESQDLLSRFIYQAPIYAFIKEVTRTESRVLYASENYKQMIGIPGSAMVGKTMAELFPADLAEKFTTDDWIVVSAGKGLELTEEMNDRSYITHKFPIHQVGRTLLAGFTIDITERRNSERELQSNYRLLQALINSPRDLVIFSLDGHYRYTAFNQKHAEEMRRVWHKDPEIGTCILDLMEGEELRRLARTSMDRALAGEEFTEIQTQASVGARFEFLWGPILDDGGRVVGLTAFVRDITERKLAEEAIRTLNTQLEHRVQERTSQLQASNQELEAFAYSVSHDLRAPLRAIDGFTRILCEDNPEKFDEEGRRVIDIIRANTRQMDQLIQDLLELSRVARRELEFPELDMTALVRAAYAEVATPKIQSRVTFQLATLPAASGDPILLRQVWINLLSNAIKYSSGVLAPRIDISGVVEEGENIYAIRDNGVGFNPAYTHKLFGVFQRLHSSSEFPGTGIGLAIVQRIITRHGGRVWAKGQLNAGATFNFTLPCKGGPA